MQAYNEACGPTGKPGRNLLELAAPRRRVALVGGVLAGARYNRIESFSLRYKGECVDCQVRPFAGLYGELFQPGRTVALYGEWSLSRFQSKGAQRLGYNAMGEEEFNAFNYRAWLSTVRLGVRYFASLPHEQQLLFGAGYELNFVMRPQVTTTSGPTATPSREELYFASPTLLPNFGVGWRRQRLTLSLDGQLYFSSDMTDTNSRSSTMTSASQFAGALFFGTNFAARLGVAYRLGRHPDDAKPRPAATR
ncbi:hypothetical protein ACFQT0_21820 [Hymenobacter humi]|uniref:Outer membrane protein beta-barrel domain-containing protein n=1 Tax=Hymenobacter humi TaxID=1411620 RepID=A0ABW2UBN1_9BACT